MGVAAFFGMFAGIYHWFPKMFGRHMNNTLSYIHFWGTIVCAYLIFFPMHWEYMLPRRYPTHAGFDTFGMFAQLNEFITIAAMASFAFQLIFVFNFFYSIWYGRKLKEQNPYHATTLEWTHRSARVTVTGLAIFLKCTAGHMITASMGVISYLKQNRCLSMRSSMANMAMKWTAM